MLSGCLHMSVPVRWPASISAVHPFTNKTQTQRRHNNRELLLPPKLAAKAPPDLKASVELLRQILDGSLQLDPAKRLTPAQALALFGTGK